jgi:integrase
MPRHNASRDPSLRPRKLTVKFCESLKSRGERVEIRDLGADGLYLVCEPAPSAMKGYYARARIDGKPAKIRLTHEDGRKIPVSALADARIACAKVLREIKQGSDPRKTRKAQEQQARIAADLKARDTVASLAQEFVQKYAKVHTKSWRQTERSFERNVLPAWHGRSVHDIRKRDFIELIEGIAFGDGKVPPRPVLANRVHEMVGQFFNWCAERDVIAASPCQGVRRPAKEVPRDRVLDDQEVVRLWSACDEIDPLYAAAIRLLVLLGQRRGEVAGMAWHELDRDKHAWLLPGVRAKNARDHLIPLPPQAWKIIESVPEVDGASELVFGKRLTNFSDAKIALDRKLQFAAPWRVHDLRRTCASGLQKTGAPPHVIEKVLNHASGTFAGIVGTYQKFSYESEKAAALCNWANYVERLVSGSPADNVVAMRG